MKKSILLFVMMAFSSISLLGQNFPTFMNYQGVLKDASGNAVNGNQNVTFKIYDDAFSDNALWTETQTVSVANGIFNVTLGGSSPLLGVPFDRLLFLGITIGSGSELIPRTALSVVPFSFMARDIRDQSITTNKIQDGAVTSQKVSANEIVKSINGLKDNVTLASGSNITITPAGNTLTISSTGGGTGTITGVTAGTGLIGGGTSGNVTIGIQNGGVGTIQIMDSSVTSSKFSLPISLSKNRSDYLISLSNPGSGDGLRAYSNSQNKLFAGVYGVNNSTGTGVYGYSANGFGIYGYNADGGNFGFIAAANGDLNNVSGVYGQHGNSNNSGALGTPIAGVWAYGSGTGVWSQGNPAGNFLGNVNISGNLSKGGGSFKIDHPLDPANKFLYHSFVESPDMMNIYNGNVTTDEAGYATVNLPGWFEALNKDFRYQLTVIGTFAQAIISRKIQNNQFIIQTNKPNVEVSWQVTGIRQDPYAESHRIQVEVMKNENERGKYLYPIELGFPESAGIYFEKRQQMQPMNGLDKEKILKEANSN